LFWVIETKTLIHVSPKLNSTVLIYLTVQLQVEPANDGTFQHDVLLTEQQANTLINEINQGGTRQAPAGLQRRGNRRRGRRSALFMETAPTQRWPAGQQIPFLFDATLCKAYYLKKVLLDIGERFLIHGYV
jgi:hypothetical protein